MRATVAIVEEGFESLVDSVPTKLPLFRPPSKVRRTGVSFAVMVMLPGPSSSKVRFPPRSMDSEDVVVSLSASVSVTWISRLM